MLHRKILDCPGQLLKALAVLGLFLSLPAGAVNVVVQLKNGDRITGELVAQETNHVVITTSWASSLVLPISAIGGLKTAEGNVLYAPPPPPAKPAAASPAPQAKAKPAPAAPKKHLTTTVNFGLDVLSGAKERQIYYTRIKSTYARTYESYPKRSFRTIADYAANYGETDGAKSANNMAGSLQTDFDFGPNTYFYNAGNVGYDEIRKIDLQYGVGPGLGRHLYRKPSFVLDLESGVNYQVQERSAGNSPEDLYLRLADNMTWKLAERLTLAKKFEFILNFDDASQFRFRLDSNLSYRLWNSLSLNLTVLDTYDTDPAPGVDNNEVQVRSSLGITF
jgi:putative salt-induced outer membrane protein YdiY